MSAFLHCHTDMHSCRNAIWHAGTALTPWGRLSFVDLAGNERADRTGNMGARMEESKAINKSLFNLQACLKELRWNQQNAAEREPRNVPYRASKVTSYARVAELGGLGTVHSCLRGPAGAWARGPQSHCALNLHISHWCCS